ncbi:hypothetical protein ASPBRDRAFT_49529 [Aspergillus brasiliensis CBS 101740]|uniref:Uncharacterized protein n=1 Tax=Aspergillus brasiliensis (strain CBS 101740 / IMI 381727 / IBT 21946) TaxID=767769 RepID=A0A1L9U1Z5_ASPBC|nr:hypothetical protein ASPBRDRAFT_49529 [Aspergillus brasiliensis CBS 101740]
MTTLHTLDVTDSANDNEVLKHIYKAETAYSKAEVEGTGDWLIPNPVLARGPFQHITAIVINISGGEGSVSIFRGNDHLQSYQTSPNSKSKVTMVFLNPGCYCWWVKSAQVKVINQPE